ncbi:conjugal transfer relaxosome DNA-binding protein TraM [Lelliottia nimipressuralis]|uniref:Relaxosome protein TraM n=1 Tax=Lelliottia nimipressuralis TaxID=69220 RepID=A0ABD4KFH9_9ENTR|nr:conjugal transfer relaxosome DNA-binding protein TraM [Lelliottia nimipressuralis]MBF4180394.1 relaxosome protein TraM [Lelliottia nimipressuralis]
MPKIQVYVNNAALDKINDIVEEKRQGGASMQDASISSTASMLIELGIRVYCIQLERGQGGFNQAEFNRTMLEYMVKTNSISNELLKLAVKGNLSQEELTHMKLRIRDHAATELERFYPQVQDDEA